MNTDESFGGGRRMVGKPVAWIALIASVAAAACSGGSTTDSGTDTGTGNDVMMMTDNGTDAGHDVASDIAADVQADVAPDVVADVAPDVAGDVQADVETDAGTDVQADVAADAGTMVFVRAAHLSPDGPAVDFCETVGGTTTGPLLAGVGQTAGLTYPHVTLYLSALPGTTVTVINAGADCTAPALLPPIPIPAATPPGTYLTLAAIGIANPDAGGAPAIRAVTFVDDHSAPPTGTLRVRFINTVPGAPPLDVGLVQATDAGPSIAAVIITNVMFGGFGMLGADAVGLGLQPLDANGYLTAPVISGDLGVAPTGSATPLLVIPAATAGALLTTGVDYTFFAIAGATGPAGFACADSAPPTGLFTTCAQVP